MRAYAFAVLLFASNVFAETSDADAFRARLAACKTDGCRTNVEHVFGIVVQHTRMLELVYFKDNERARVEAQLKKLRAQLHDPNIFTMMEDGRWKAMSMREQAEYIKKNWGIDPMERNGQ
jgi:hypothetical protein